MALLAWAMTIACAAPTGAAQDVAPRSSAPPSAPATARPAPVLTGARLARASLARGLDASGRPTGETTTFEQATDSAIVLAIELDAATLATTVGYRRYFRGSFVDAKSSHPTHAGSGIVTFAWRKSSGTTFPAGSYQVHVLIDGRDVQTLPFAVR